MDHLYLPHYKSPTALFDMHHLTCGISSRIAWERYFCFQQRVFLGFVLVRWLMHSIVVVATLKHSHPSPSNVKIGLSVFLLNKFLWNHAVKLARVGFIVDLSQLLVVKNSSTPDISSTHCTAILIDNGWLQEDWIVYNANTRFHPITFVAPPQPVLSQGVDRVYCRSTSKKAVILNEAKTSRPRPRTGLWGQSRGRGQN